MSNLIFPSGLTINRAKDRAKKLLKDGEARSLNEAQDLISTEEMGVSWAKAMKIINNHHDIATCKEWVFIPLSHDLATLLHLWTRSHFNPLTELDKKLEENIENLLPDVFKKNGFEYNLEKYGMYRLKLGRSNNGSDGILMPKDYFTQTPNNIQIHDNPNLTN